MSLQAARFSVSLERRGAGDAVCLVTTDTDFTQRVQSALKFSITSRAADGSRTKVPLRQVARRSFPVLPPSPGPLPSLRRPRPVPFRLHGR